MSQSQNYLAAVLGELASRRDECVGVLYSLAKQQRMYSRLGIKHAGLEYFPTKWHGVLGEAVLCVEVTGYRKGSPPALAILKTGFIVTANEPLYDPNRQPPDRGL